VKLDPHTLRAALKQADTRRRRGGMNLVEIMIVIAIIVILISVLSVAAVQAYEASKVSTTTFRINQLSQIVLAETMLAGSEIPKNLKDVEGVKEDQLVDGWNREFIFEVPGPGDSPFDIISLGRDGKEGGTGRDKDLKYSEL